LERVNSTIHGTTYQIPLERFKEENLSHLDQVPPYRVVHKETRKISRDCYISFLGISILFLTGLQEEMQSCRYLMGNSRFMLIMRRSVNTKFFQATAELPGKGTFPRVS